MQGSSLDWRMVLTTYTMRVQNPISLPIIGQPASGGSDQHNGIDMCDGSDDNYIVDLNDVDGKGRNALHIAIQNNCPADIIEKLINRSRLGCHMV